MIMPTPFETRRDDALKLVEKLEPNTPAYNQAQDTIDRLKRDDLIESVPWGYTAEGGGMLVSYTRLIHELGQAYEAGTEVRPSLDNVENLAAGLLSSYIGAGDTNTDRDVEVGFLYGMAELTLTLTGIKAEESYAERREEIAREIDDLAFSTYAAPYRVIARVEDL